MRILIVEDEERLAGLIRTRAMADGYAVDAVHTGEDALEFVRFSKYDVIILDVMLPDIDGLQVCRTLRKRQMQTPVLLLTAKDGIDDRVAGLDAGADDYLVKPFAFAELFARLRALTRRPAETLNPILVVGDLRLNPATRTVWRSKDEFQLPNKEFGILETLMRRPNQVMTRSMIAEQVWDYDFDLVTNVIDVHIRSLRRKIDDPYPDKYIQTVRGVGYTMAIDG